MEIKIATKTVSVGVIGTGGMGTRHAANIHRFIGGAQVAGVYDLDQGHAAQAAAQCGDAVVFDDPMKLIQDDRIDAVQSPRRMAHTPR
jgi:myo-inositol 2-dehydrogenase/D-chiro-inositol 1-dehydrogenase